MRDWRTYWNAVAPAATAEQFLRQVGKTVNGVPVAEESLDLIAASIAAALRLAATDSLLDLCCGNGLLTVRCAEKCAEVTAVDYSEPLIETARRSFARANVRYVVADVTALPSEVLDVRHTKVSMYEALQHFSTEQAGVMLRSLRGSASRQAQLFLGSIPDAGRIWNFYDTPERRADFEQRARDGVEAIGHWWHIAELEQIASDHGYSMNVLSTDARLYTSHYRFDALLTPARER